MKKVGFIGLGRMGKSMALNMARKGFELAVYDINDEPMRAFTEFNLCRQAATANDAAKDAEITITVLPGPAELESVALAAGGSTGTHTRGRCAPQARTVYDTIYMRAPWAFGAPSSALPGEGLPMRACG